MEKIITNFDSHFRIKNEPFKFLFTLQEVIRLDPAYKGHYEILHKADDCIGFVRMDIAHCDGKIAFLQLYKRRLVRTIEPTKLQGREADIIFTNEVSEIDIEEAKKILKLKNRD